MPTSLREGFGILGGLALALTLPLDLGYLCLSE